MSSYRSGLLMIVTQDCQHRGGPRETVTTCVTCNLFYGNSRLLCLRIGLCLNLIELKRTIADKHRYKYKR